MTQPPLGLTPQFIRDEQRLKEIKDAVARYFAVDQGVPLEWIEEAYEIQERLKKRAPQSQTIAADEWRHICKDDTIRALKDTVYKCDECGLDLSKIMNKAARERRGLVDGLDATEYSLDHECSCHASSVHPCGLCVDLGCRYHVQRASRGGITNAMVAEELVTLRQLLLAAKEALVATGYFKPEEVGDDIAPRITEMWYNRDETTVEHPVATDDVSLNHWICERCHVVHSDVCHPNLARRCHICGNSQFLTKDDEGAYHFCEICKGLADHKTTRHPWPSRQDSGVATDGSDIVEHMKAAVEAARTFSRWNCSNCGRHDAGFLKLADKKCPNCGHAMTGEDASRPPTTLKEGEEH